ncbi:type VI secretion system-associated FHA domain protein TagH [Nitrincola sp. MINF-07-Sa-05]|uniref:type VI secretion system-associated FHA domain protein TagH n=1 Tax=Nitrincola salilacus TaxID=3400273 RepID=UPI003917B9A6
MLMELTVISEQQSQLKDRCSIQLENELLSIGRGSDNHWVLPDDNLHLSGKHCIVSRKNDSFIITDLSTNGVYLDSQETPLGRGRSAVLKHGSLIRIGDYQISVSIDQLPYGESSTSVFHSDGYTAGGLATALADTSSASAVSTSSAIKTSDDHLSPERVSLMTSRSKPLPELQPVLPDDWFLTMDSDGLEPKESRDIPEPPEDRSDVFAPAPAPAPATVNVEEETVSDPVPLKSVHVENRQSVATVVPTVNADADALSETDLLKRILLTAGLDPSLVKDAPMLADRLGLLLKTFANGMIQALTTRSLVKGEFRLQQTMIQPTDNNPFKFSPTGREALNIILFSEGQAYQSGNKAIEESYADIQAHQLAMMSGVQESLFKLLNRLDPESLEQQFQRKPRHFTGLPGMKKVNCWEEYKEFHETLKASMSDDLQGFFIKEFGMAYEGQLKKLNHEA